MTKKSLNKKRVRRAKRVRARILGTAQRPRLSVFRSNRYTYIQLINDLTGKTLISASTYGLKESGNKSSKAGRLGKIIAEKAKEKGISKVVIDRGKYKYHGRIRAVAESLKEEGINI